MSDPDDNPAARIPMPEEGPLREVAGFLEWCRLRGYQVGPVIEYGNGRVRMQVADLRQPQLEGLAAPVKETMSADFALLTGGHDDE